MALASYSDLKSAVADWLARTDLTSRIPDFITLAESRVNRELRVREMVSQVTGTVGTATLAIPSDFIEVLRFTLDTETDAPLEYRPVDDSEHRAASLSSGPPAWFSVIGGQFRLYPQPDGDYAYMLDYYAQLPALSDSNTTNWLLEKAPDVYLFGALAEAAPFLLDDQRLMLWDGRFQTAKRSLQGAEARAKRASGPRRMRIVA